MVTYVAYECNTNSNAFIMLDNDTCPEVPEESHAETLIKAILIKE